MADFRGSEGLHSVFLSVWAGGFVALAAISGRRVKNSKVEFLEVAQVEAFVADLTGQKSVKFG